MSDVGTPCSECGTLDFLPIKCDRCGELFCAEHVKIDNHPCSAPPPRQDTADGPTGPSFRELLSERDVIQSPAVVSPEGQAKKAKQAAALEKLKSSLAAKDQSASSTSKPRPVSGKVTLMKLKQAAKPVDEKMAKNTPLSERRFVNVAWKEDVKPVWLPKNLIAGRALDLIAAYLKVVNRNDSSLTTVDDRLHLLDSIGAETSSSSKVGDICQDGDLITLVKGKPE